MKPAIWIVGLACGLALGAGAWAQSGPGDENAPLCKRQLVLLHERCDAVERQGVLQMDSALKAAGATRDLEWWNWIRAGGAVGVEDGPGAVPGPKAGEK